MNPASAAVTAASTLVWGPYTSALFVDPGAFDGLFTSRPALEEGSGEEALSNETPGAIFNHVRPALTLLLPNLDKTGFLRFGLQPKFVAAEEDRLEAEHFLHPLGKALAVFGEDHPEEYRKVLRAAVGGDLFPKLHIEAGNLDAFVRLTNWKARKERELFWKRAQVEAERSRVAVNSGTMLMIGGLVVAGVGGFLSRPFLNHGSLESVLLVGGVALFLALGLSVLATREIRGALRRERQLTQEIVSPEDSPVFPEFLPAVSRHDPDVVGKLFSDQIKQWIRASLRDGASVR